MNKKVNLSKIILTIIIVLIVLGAGYSFTRWFVSPSRFVASTETHIYHDEQFGFTINYPANFPFTLEQVGTSTSPLKKLNFSANGLKVGLTVYSAPKNIAIAERLFNEKSLFGDPKQKNSFKMTTGSWEGFKSMQDFNKASYFLYNSVSTSTTMIVHADVYSANNPNFAKVEEIFLRIVSTIVPN